MNLNPYLRFSGNCREVLAFYQACLGGELEVQTIGASPMAANMPANMHDKALHATLKSDAVVIMGSDMGALDGITAGDSVNLMLNLDSEAQAREIYAKLAAGGKATHPLENTFWGAVFGDLTDRYGVQWLIHFDQNQVRR